MAARKKPAAGRRARPTKPAPKKRTAPDWGPAFLICLSQTGNISASCRAAGVHRDTFYQRRDADPAFARAARTALREATDALELEARRRAHDGVRRVKFHQGEPILVPAVGADGAPVLVPEEGPDGKPAPGGKLVPLLVPYVEHEYSDTLLIFLLKAHRPKKYRERYEVKHSGKIGTTPAADLTDAQLAEIAAGGQPK